MADLIVEIFTPWTTSYFSKAMSRQAPAWTERESASAVAILSAFGKCLLKMKEAGAGQVYMNAIYRFIKEKILFAPVQPSHILVSTHLDRR